MEHITLSDEWEQEWAEWERTDPFITRVEDGRKGHALGMPNGMGRINDYLYGTHTGRYYLIGADSGVGKSTMADEMLFTLWHHCRSTKLELSVNYWSMEMSLDDKKAQFTARMVSRLFGHKGVNMPADYVLGRIHGQSVTNTDMKYIHAAYSIVKEFFASIRFHEYSINPTGMFMDALTNFYGPTHGLIIRQPLTPEQKADGWKDGRIIGWKPHNPRRVVVQVIDHVALGDPEKGLHSTKDVIDKQSMYAVKLRNLFGMSTFAIQQFNTELSSTFRMQKRSEAALHPQRIDFGDSKYTFRDADAVLGLLKPADYDLPTFHKFDVRALGNYLVFVFLMKNRYGTSGKLFPKFLNPYSGIFHDLPTDPLNALAMDPWHKEAKRLDSIWQHYKPVYGSFLKSP